MPQDMKPTSLKARLGTKAMAAVAMSFFLIGLVVASELPWSGGAVANSATPDRAAVSTTAERPQSFADLAARLSPTVVNIKVTQVHQNSSWQSQVDPNGPFGEFFKRFFRDMPQGPESYRQQGTGSGVIISKDGYIVTNNHVVDGASSMTVTLADQREYEGHVVGQDPKTDLAVIKIDPKGDLPVAAMGDATDLRVGDWVMAIGNPFGLSQTVTTGIVSAKGRIIGAGPYDDFIQTDASINPGNSGGPLFNMQGDIVGINTAIVPNGQGIGFAIPVNTAKPLIPQLMHDGSVTRGYLGVNIQTLTPELSAALKLNDHKGALVSEVMSDSPAEKAGIKRGDVIVGFEDKTIANARELAATVASMPVGDKAKVLILRNGDQQSVNVKVGKLQDDTAKTAQTDEATKGKWGLQLQDLNADDAREQGLTSRQGVQVVAVQPGSPADAARVQAGDIILQVNQKPVESVNDVKAAIANGEDANKLLLLVQRDNNSFFVAMAQ